MRDPGASRARIRVNRFHAPVIPAALVPPAPADVAAVHRSLPGYTPTPLAPLPGLAAALGLRELWVKDESRRFGLGAFKALGASYAIRRFLAERERGPQTFATATAGNHGRAVAWTARITGHRAAIFVPAHTVPARVAALRGEGAEVTVVPGTYDDAVQAAARESAARGWQVISDTAYPGYTEIPGWIMEGYTTLFAEATEELEAAGRPDPDLVLLQAGVGGLAWAGTCFYARRAGVKRPRLVAVEPIEADCLGESIAAPEGQATATRGRLRTIMAGLNAGTPSPAAWPLLRAAMNAFLAVDDGYAEEAMRRLHAGAAGDPRVIAGESGAAGVAGLLALCREPALAAARSALGLDEDARVLVVISEGATDPASYRRIVGVDP
jgi:diaminopropionate ammonia-lyase